MSVGAQRSRLAPIVVGAVAVCCATAASAAERSFAIPPQSLASALNAFGEQSGAPLLYRRDLVQTSRSGGVMGRLEPEDALRALLAGSGFEQRRVGRGFVILRSPVAVRPATRAGPSAGDRAGDPAAPIAAAVPEVVVTGTLVRGVAPAGGQVVTYGAEELARFGVVQPNQLFGAIPQMAGFNTLVRTQTALQGVTLYRPNLRSLPPLQNGTTLVLLDSHNLVGSPVQQNFSDIGMLPAGAIERVELALDGGSATYGSDTVGGVINFITRSSFDGLQLKATAGGAGPHHRAYAVEALAGRNWSSGGTVAAFSARRNNPLNAADRDLPRQDLTPYGFSDFRVRSCNAPNIIISGVTYALPAAQPGTQNLCDSAAFGSIMPQEQQVGGYLSVSQTVSPTLELEFKGFFSDRRTVTKAAQLGESGAVIDRSNPFFRSLQGESRQTVAFSWAPVLGPNTASEVRVKVVDFTPNLTWRMAGGWQTKAMLDYGVSHITQRIPQINTVAETAALRGEGLTRETALNPYDLAATNPAVLKTITDYWNFSRAEQSLLSARVILDGPVFTLPGGPVRLAVGAQGQVATADSLTLAGPVGDYSGAVRTERSRRVDAVFGEVVAPLIGPDSAVPLVRRLNLALSARYNTYEHIGSTLDPKVGVTWVLIEGLKVRGNWGTAFVAPGLNDSYAGGIDSTALVTATTTSLRAGDPLSDRNRPNIALTGGTGDLRPVTAETWAVGADYRPAWLEGVSLSLTRWSIEMDDLIQAGCANSLADQLANAALEGSCYFYKPDLATALDLTRQYRIIQGSSAAVASLYGAGNDPYYIQDRRRRNYGGFNSTGLDFKLGYSTLVDWGAIDAGLAGTYYLTREQQQVRGGPFVDLLAANNPKLLFEANIGVTIGRFTSAATWFHTAGYRLSSVVNQSRVGAYDTVNLYARYALDDDTAVTLNIDNVADADPPVVNQSGGLATFAIGRYVSASIRRRF